MKALTKYALSFVGVPYKWGGDNPSDGFDCSGLLQEILASVGIDPPGDQTADKLFLYFTNQGKLIMNPEAGALVFFGHSSENTVTHCAFCIDEYRMVEAAGTYVRVRPVKSRKDRVAVLMPYYVRFY